MSVVYYIEYVAYLTPFALLLNLGERLAETIASSGLVMLFYGDSGTGPSGGRGLGFGA